MIVWWWCQKIKNASHARGRKNIDNPVATVTRVVRDCSLVHTKLRSRNTFPSSARGRHNFSVFEALLLVNYPHDDALFFAVGGHFLHTLFGPVKGLYPGTFKMNTRHTPRYRMQQYVSESALTLIKEFRNGCLLVVE